MLVTLISKRYIHTISLPKKIQGLVVLGDNGIVDKDTSIQIEGVSGQWILKSSRYVKIIEDDEMVKSTVLEPMNTYFLKSSNGESYIVFTEPDTLDRQTFTKYLVPDNCDIIIGRDDDTHICFDKSYVSGAHAKLSCATNGWSITDLDSVNGTYLNNERITTSALHLGDVIFIMGLRIVIGPGMISVNNPDGSLYLSSALNKYSSEEFIASDDEYEMDETEYFYRSPRFKRDVETAVFKIDSPPNSFITDDLPLPLVLGSSLAMGAMSIVTVYNAVISNNILSVVTGGAMLVGSLIMPVIVRTYQKKHKIKKEEERKLKYREYLRRVKNEINDAMTVQRDILYENNTNMKDCKNRILNTQSNLWERAYGQNDYLRITVGVGECDLDADFQYSERKFSVENDVLVEELYDLCENNRRINDIPVSYSLLEHNISGVIGDHNSIISFAKGMIIQLAAMYSYDELKMAFIYDSEDEEQLDFVKWLPHVWNEEKSFRFIATNTSEMKELSSYFNGVVENRSSSNEEDKSEDLPYYIFFSFSHSLTVRSEILKQIFSNKKKINISVVTVFDELKQLPKECTMVTELKGMKGSLYDKNNASGIKIPFESDMFYASNPYDLSVKLANTFLDVSSASFKLPKAITFLEMFGVGKVEHLNSVQRWKENDPTKSLETAIGVDSLGDTFMLDLHEKYHGPHGLVAGMTGSGKSEFIITFILSLAVNYHPNEVAFILIDYKGGGMAKAFENLPHTAGIITNLDGSMIKRSLTSIESELKRRQTLFSEASSLVGESNIDIYKYQKLYREGRVTEPLQHLFIISDEFAELKTSQPEFMEQLISAARIGRSLGVHLILATQKPSGVVDDQIWSNSKFRVCLRVQDRSDSMDMIKRPDAAELVNTGRFYLQVGYNELFELGQSAWAGARYEATDRVIAAKDNSVAVIDKNGHVIKAVSYSNNSGVATNSKKQLDAITDYLCNIANENSISIRKLWVDPIPEKIFYNDLLVKYATSINKERFVLNPVIGEYDDPTNQRTMPLTVPISSEGNVIVYGASGSGKTTFFNAIIYSLIKEHTPDEVNLYLMDFASETLRAFSKAPHVGDVILASEDEKIRNLLKMVKSDLDTRKRLFADFGGDYRSYVETSGSTLPSVVIMINNYAAFTEMYPDYDDAVNYLSREGVKYGIYFVLSAVGTNGIRFRMLQNFKQLFTMQLNDTNEYSSVVGKTDGLFPSKYKGRGLVRLNELYEFQTAYLTEDNVPFSFIQSECNLLKNDWDGQCAKRIPVLPDVVDTSFVGEHYDFDRPYRIPVGVNKETFAVTYFDFANSYLNLILSDVKEHRQFADDITSVINLNSNFKAYYLTAGEKPVGANNVTVVNDVNGYKDVISELFDVVRDRNNEYKTAVKSNEEPPKYPPIIIVINSLSSIMNKLEGEVAEKLNLILEKGEKEYAISIVIADDVKSISANTYSAWYKHHISGNDGIWLGNGVANQYQIRLTAVSKNMRSEIPSDYGYVVNNGKAVQLKMLCNANREEDYE